MTKINLAGLTIKKANEMLCSGDISARELAAFYLENIQKHDKEIHAYLEVFDDVYEQAEAVDLIIKKGRAVPLLAGIPFAVKDNILIKNRKCSAGSKILENFTAPYNATVIDKLKNEGAVFVGRTNMDEFAMGSSTEHSAFGPTKNPHDTSRVPGGSSGGSAAAVAQQECLSALGSDTGGSIRQPAAFCGVVGMKPTYGSVSRNGLMAMASSLDQIGPFAKTVEDAEIIFDAIKGKDALDSTTVEVVKKYGSGHKIQNLKVGIPKEFIEFGKVKQGFEEEVSLAFQEAVGFLKNSGVQVKEVSIPALKYSLEVYYILMPAEVSSNLARYDGIRYGFSKKGENLLETYMETRAKGFGEEARRRILVGTYVLSAGYYDAYYSRAQKVRNLMKQDFARAFKEVDVILSPTVPTLPFKIGEKIDDPVKMYMADILTIAANLTGVPAISVPYGVASVEEGKNLPLAVQLMASWFEEEKMFALAKVLQK